MKLNKEKFMLQQLLRKS